MFHSVASDMSGPFMFDTAEFTGDAGLPHGAEDVDGTSLTASVEQSSLAQRLKCPVYYAELTPVVKKLSVDLVVKLNGEDGQVLTPAVGHSPSTQLPREKSTNELRVSSSPSSCRRNLPCSERLSVDLIRQVTGDEKVCIREVSVHLMKKKRRTRPQCQHPLDPGPLSLIEVSS